MSMNRVVLMGRITRDLELRRTQVGKAVTNFSLAVDRDFKNSDGTKTTDFFDVVCWGASAEFAVKYFAKGRQVAVDGKLQSRAYTDKDGKKRTLLEIVAESLYFADSKPVETASYVGTEPEMEEVEETEGDLPF